MFFANFESKMAFKFFLIYLMKNSWLWKNRIRNMVKKALIPKLSEFSVPRPYSLSIDEK